MRRYRSLLNEFQTRFSARPPSLLERAGLWAWLGAALEHHNRLLNSGWAGGFEGRRTEILTSPNSRQRCAFAARRNQRAGTECRRAPGMFARTRLALFGNIYC